MLPADANILLDIDDFAKALESAFDGKATILNRMRLACTFYNQDLAKKGDDEDGASVTTLQLICITQKSVRLASHERDCTSSGLEPSPEHH